ncbi:MAG: thioredoxin-dependent thiol peroxidase [Alphaproteobacteria bacterium]
MSPAETGNKAPDFILPRDGGGEISLAQFKGQTVVLYFYPKNDTPGCTQESCDFRDALADFGTLNAQVIGISKDSVKSHDKFRDKYSLNFPLASDEEGHTCEDYGVWMEKSMYGKKYMGIDRSTFLIDKDGKIAQAWRGVKVPDHVNAVKKTLKNL